MEEEKQRKDGKKKKKRSKQRRYSRCPRSRILNRKNDRRMSKADESGDEVNLFAVMLLTAIICVFVFLHDHFFQYLICSRCLAFPFYL